MEFKHALGIQAKDIITGFKGIIIGRAEHLYGCNTYGITPQNLTKEGGRKETDWFDEDRIQPISLSKKITPKKIRKNGGPLAEIPKDTRK